MADNVTLPGTGAVVATDDVSGIQFQIMKLDIGGNGVSVPVSGYLPVKQDDATATGTTTNNGDTVEFSCNGLGTAGLSLSSSLAAVVEIEGTINGSTWGSVQAVDLIGGEPASTVPVSSPTEQIFEMAVGPLQKLRVRQTGTFGGTITVVWRGNAASSLTRASSQLPKPKPVPVLNASVSVAAGNLSATVDLGGRACATIILSGTWSGTVQFLLDGNIVPFVTYTAAGGYAIDTLTTANGTFSIATSGASGIRVSASSVASGTVVAGIVASDQPGFNVAQIVAGHANFDLGKNANATFVNPSTGVMALAVRKNTGAALIGTDGAFSPLQVDSAGQLRVTGLSTSTLTGYDEFDFVTGLNEQNFTFPNSFQTAIVKSDNKPVLLRFNGSSNDQILLEPYQSLELDSFVLSSIYYLAPDWTAQHGRVKVIGEY